MVVIGRKRKDCRLVLLGEHVRELRTKAAYSQEKFAYACGLHPNYMGGIERGERNVAVLNLYKIADALNMPLSELLNFDNPKS